MISGGIEVLILTLHNYHIFCLRLTRMAYVFSNRVVLHFSTDKLLPLLQFCPVSTSSLDGIASGEHDTCFLELKHHIPAVYMGYGNSTQRRRSRRRRRRRDADDGLILTQREAVRAHIKSSLGAMEKQN